MCSQDLIEISKMIKNQICCLHRNTCKEQMSDIYFLTYFYYILLFIHYMFAGK